jgi:hypothetical protein
MRRATLVFAVSLALGATFEEDGPVAAPVGQPDVGGLPGAVANAARAAANLPLPERMKAVSELLLGKPYVLDPMGEGFGKDADPLARYDAFDCLTFLEETLALSLAADPTDAGRIRHELRYGDAPVAYGNRHHFMELQWIPANQQRGFIRPTSGDYGVEPTHLAKTVTRETWAKWSRRRLFTLTDEELPTGPIALDALSIDAALKVVDKIRPGTLVFTVRADRAGVPIWISHVGFTVPAEVPTVRHATKIGSDRSRDQGLAWYLNHLRTYKNWPAFGVSLWEPIEQGPRRIAP